MAEPKSAALPLGYAPSRVPSTRNGMGFQGGLAIEPPAGAHGSRLGPPLHRHRAPLVRAPYGGRVGVMAGNDAHALVQLVRDDAGRTNLEKGYTVLFAGGEHPRAGFLHLGRIGIARHF